MRAIPLLDLAKASARAGAGRVGRLLTRQGGSASVEFALVSVPFIGLVLAILQVGMIYFAQEALESAVETTMRVVLTGQALGANTTQVQFHTDLCNNSPGLFICSDLMFDLQSPATFTAANVAKPTLTFSGNTVTNAWQYNLGAPGDIMVLRVMYLWPVFLGPLNMYWSNEPNNQLLLMATSVFRNEP
jgi:Flp pilus assembly protein TadG